MGVCTSCLTDMSDAMLDDGMCPNCRNVDDDEAESALKDFVGYADDSDE